MEKLQLDLKTARAEKRETLPLKDRQARAERHVQVVERKLEKALAGLTSLEEEREALNNKLREQQERVAKATADQVDAKQQLKDINARVVRLMLAGF